MNLIAADNNLVAEISHDVDLQMVKILDIHPVFETNFVQWALGKYLTNLNIILASLFNYKVVTKTLKEQIVQQIPFSCTVEGDSQKKIDINTKGEFKDVVVSENHIMLKIHVNVEFVSQCQNVDSQNNEANIIFNLEKENHNRNKLISGARIRLRNKHSDKCLDVPGGTSWHGSNLIQYDCHSGDNQYFNFEYRPKNYAFRLRTSNNFPKLCLRMKGFKGAILVQHFCNVLAKEHQFRVHFEGKYLKIKTSVNDMCLDVAGASRYNGVHVHAWDCHDGDSQKWIPE